MMKLMLYTTLKVDGNSLPYKVYYNLNYNKYLFKPDSKNYDLPVFHTWKRSSQWHFVGCEDTIIQKQAIDDITNRVEMNIK